jgi:LysM repeat protein
MYLRGGQNMNENNNKNLLEDTLEALPKNVRQIGDAKEGDRIYIEDYVYSYLQQVACEEKVSEQIAFLIGRNYTYNDQNVLMIDGAIKGSHTEKVNGDICITERTWYYVYEKIRRYFEDCSVVGWMYTQPGYGILLTPFLQEHHSKNFIDNKQVLYIVDPLEKEDTFFSNKTGDLIEKKGYYIYYDKNPAMHSYMLEHKAKKEETNEKDININNDIIKNFRKKDQQRKDDIYQKKFINMLSILCGGLVLICLILGIGLLSNIERLNELQTAMNSMTKKYNNIKNSDEHTNDDKELSSNNEQSNANKQTLEKNQKAQSSDTTMKKTTTMSKGIVPETYIIQSGDTLNTISEKFYYSQKMVPTIQELNGIDNPNKILVGQEIKLPKP